MRTIRSVSVIIVMAQFEISEKPNYHKIAFSQNRACFQITAIRIAAGD
jgi:hypothetical protein